MHWFGKNVLALPAEQAEPLKDGIVLVEMHLTAGTQLSAGHHAYLHVPGGHNHQEVSLQCPRAFGRQALPNSLLGAFRHYRASAALTTKRNTYQSGCDGGASSEISFSHWYVAVGWLKGGNTLPFC